MRNFGLVATQKRAWPTAREVDEAHDKLQALEDLEERLSGLLDDLESETGEDFHGVAEEILDVINTQKDECYEVLCEDDEHEQREMEREYWAMVL